MSASARRRLRRKLQTGRPIASRPPATFDNFIAPRPTRREFTPAGVVRPLARRILPA